jgi:hypothetical protein
MEVTLLTPIRFLKALESVNIFEGKKKKILVALELHTLKGTMHFPRSICKDFIETSIALCEALQYRGVRMIRLYREYFQGGSIY